MSSHHDRVRWRLLALFTSAVLVALSPSAPAADQSFAVLFSTDKGVSVWNAEAGQLSTRVNRVDGVWNPKSMAAHPNGRWVFGLNRTNGEIVVLDRVTHKTVARRGNPIGTEAYSMALSPSGTRLYVTYRAPTTSTETYVVTLNARNPALAELHRLRFEGVGSHVPMAVSADGAKLYVGHLGFQASQYRTRVIEIDTGEAKTGAPAIAAETPLVLLPEILNFWAQDVALSRDGRTLWVVGEASGAASAGWGGIVKVDLSRRQVASVKQLGTQRYGNRLEVAAAPISGDVYVMLNNELVFLSPSMDVMHSMPFGSLQYATGSRDTFAVSPDGLRGYVVRPEAVRVVDLVSRQELPAWSVPGARPDALTVSPVGEATAKAATVHGDQWWLAGDDAGENVAPQARNFRFGGAYPLLCDWDGDGVKTPGTFNAATSEWTITNTLPPSNPITFKFGFGPSDWPVCGDWNGDGTQTVGVVNNRIMWHLRNSNSAGAADVALSFDVPLGWRQPIAGDWDGNGTDTPGYFYGATAASANEWFLKNDLASGRWHTRFVYNPCLEQGKSGCAAIVGDWTGAGFTSVGVVADEPSQVTRNWMLRHSLSSGQADNTFLFGPMKGRALTWR